MLGDAKAWNYQTYGYVVKGQRLSRGGDERLVHVQLDVAAQRVLPTEVEVQERLSLLFRQVGRVQGELNGASEQGNSLF